ncbi:MAG: hypothetical protein L0Z62_08040 [Gemmataceae bacterium]|nr:hypothetical protein [Gemmataceae bacterium]
MNLPDDLGREALDILRTIHDRYHQWLASGDRGHPLVSTWASGKEDPADCFAGLGLTREEALRAVSLVERLDATPRQEVPPDLLAACKGLVALITAIREEQVSAQMGFGNTEREKRERATIYAAEIQRQALKVEDATFAALDAIARAEVK